MDKRRKFRLLFQPFLIPPVVRRRRAYRTPQDDPEVSDVWQDLGTCDPDMQHTRIVFAKRSSTIQARDAGETSNCLGYIDWREYATFRAGSTVKHGTQNLLCMCFEESFLIVRHVLDGRLWQANQWVVNVRYPHFSIMQWHTNWVLLSADRA